MPKVHGVFISVTILFPAVNTMKSTLITQDGFVAKVNPTGSTLVFSTCFGGDLLGAYEFLHGIAVDSSGNAYITGIIGSPDFPTTVTNHVSCIALDGTQGCRRGATTRGDAAPLATRLAIRSDDR